MVQVKESWDMEPEEKIEYAAKRKQEGNAYFKDGKYQRASLRYEMVSFSRVGLILMPQASLFLIP